MDSGIIISIILGGSGIICSILLGVVPQRRKYKVEALQSELLEVYQSAKQLLEIEETLTQELGKKKVTVRKGYNITKKFQPKKIDERITTLEANLK